MDPDSVKSTLSNLAFGNVMAAAARDYQKVFYTMNQPWQTWVLFNFLFRSISSSIVLRLEWRSSCILCVILVVILWKY